MYVETVSGHAGTPGEQPDFELPGQCSVFPWGISWTRGEHCSARWADIIKVEESQDFEWIVWPGGIYNGKSLFKTYTCEVELADGRSVRFIQTIRFRLPVAWTKLKPVPGVTKRVNVLQLARLIKMGGVQVF